MGCFPLFVPLLYSLLGLWPVGLGHLLHWYMGARVGSTGVLPLTSGYLKVGHIGQQLKGEWRAQVIGCTAAASEILLSKRYAAMGTISHSPSVGQLLLRGGIEVLHGYAS